MRLDIICRDCGKKIGTSEITLQTNSGLETFDHPGYKIIADQGDVDEFRNQHQGHCNSPSGDMPGCKRCQPYVVAKAEREVPFDRTVRQSDSEERLLDSECDACSTSIKTILDWIRLRQEEAWKELRKNMAGGTVS